jgi:hypothetical protein
MLSNFLLNDANFVTQQKSLITLNPGKGEDVEKTIYRIGPRKYNSKDGYPVYSFFTFH